jgi:hypothetical protein
MTSLETGNYGLAGLYFGGMLGEQVLFAVTFGQGTLGKQGGQCAISTGARVAPGNLAEQLALEEAKGGAGKRIMEEFIRDPNYPRELWAKMHHIHRNPDGSKIVIHFWQNLLTGAREGFKFKN